jgi:hypothetical protein
MENILLRSLVPRSSRTCSLILGKPKILKEELLKDQVPLMNLKGSLQKKLEDHRQLNLLPVHTKTHFMVHLSLVIHHLPLEMNHLEENLVWKIH